MRDFQRQPDILGKDDLRLEFFKKLFGGLGTFASRPESFRYEAESPTWFPAAMQEKHRKRPADKDLAGTAVSEPFFHDRE